MPFDAYVEAGAKRVFAGALDWPGWCRNARDEEGALEALIAYGPRYAAVLKSSGVRFAPYLLSEREERILRSHAPDTPAAVVPNGVDLDYFRPSGAEVEPYTLVFNGILDYRPNLDAARHLIDALVTTAPPRDREVEAEKARARSALRFARP